MSVFSGLLSITAHIYTSVHVERKSYVFCLLISLLYYDWRKHIKEVNG